MWEPCFRTKFEQMSDEMNSGLAWKLGVFCQGEGFEGMGCEWELWVVGG